MGRKTTPHGRTTVIDRPSHHRETPRSRHPPQAFRSVPVILFSGMGADERMFAKLRPLLPGLVVPGWLPPHKGETLRQYAGRMAAIVDLDRPVYIGGASFGGFLALEMLPFLPNARGCFLIGAVRSADELPWVVKALRPARPLCRIIPFQLAWWASGMLAATLGWALPRRTHEFLKLGASLDPDFFRWAAEAVLTWGAEGPPPPGGVPVYQVHGAKDRVLPPKLTRPDALVPGGGHVIALSHPAAVAAFIRQRVDPAAAPTGTGSHTLGVP
jgi:pimeloyl-ACP methyl ester carboxylesterase